MVADNVTLRVSLDPEDAERVVVRFLKDYFAGAAKAKAVVGLSGGLDSAVSAALAAKALGADNVIAYILPSATTDEQDVKDAKAVADHLGIEARTVPIAKTLAALEQEYPGFSKQGRGNAAARVRMMQLHEAAYREDALVVGTGNKSEVLTGYFCLDEQTRAITTEGPKDFSNLEPGNEVYSINLDRVGIEIVPVEAVHVFPYRGQMIHVRTRSVDLLVTPNHRMVVARNHGRGPLAFRSAENMSESSNTALPARLPFLDARQSKATIDTGVFLRGGLLARNANKPPTMTRRDWLYLLGLYIGDGHLSLTKATVSTKTGLTASQQMSHRDSAGRFAEVTGGGPAKREYLARRISIAASADGRSRIPLLRVLDRYGIHGTETPTAVLFSNRALFESFEAAGVGARRKSIPRWAFDLPSGQIQSLFRGLMDSDGTRDGSKYYTVNERLAFQVAQLCFHLGLHATVRHRPPRTSRRKDGVLIHSSGMFEVGISRRRRNLTVRARHMSRVAYEGRVWCPSVPPNENLLVERNGKFAFTGNTKYGDAGVDVQPLGDLYKTQVRILADHLGLPERVRTKAPSAGLWEGQTDEDELGLPYETLDRILLGLEIRLDRDLVADALEVERAEVDRIARLRETTQHKRRMPLMPKFGLRTPGVDWRDVTVR